MSLLLRHKIFIRSFPEADGKSKYSLEKSVVLYSNLYPDSKLKITQLQEQFYDADEIISVVGQKRHFSQYSELFCIENTSKAL